MSPILHTSSAPPSSLPISVVPSTNVEPNGRINAMSQSSTPNFIDVVMNPHSTLPVVVVPPACAETNSSPIGSCLLLAPSTRGAQNLHSSPAKPCILGYISKPEGRPSCVGGYSDVWRCSVWFSTPSEALPREVSPSTTVPFYEINSTTRVPGCR